MATLPRSTRIKSVQYTALTLLVVSGAVNYMDRATLAVANPLIRADLGVPDIAHQNRRAWMHHQIALLIQPQVRLSVFLRLHYLPSRSHHPLYVPLFLWISS